MDSEPRVSSLTTLVQYQSESVVSKVLIKKETGNVTLFAFDKGQELSEHTAPFDALVQVIEGKADVILDGKSNITKDGEMIIMPANIPHALKAVEKFKMMLIMIRS
ncbi:MAG: cupin domain-containing protein [Candidatus Marinimicrobia bacterium]|nr:cupin domain-containing protein [Candidatus Neomarinimicrobiota bacterium]